MYSRLLKKPLEGNKSFFLFGARGTGKSTWLKRNLGSEALIFDLLHSETFLDLTANPSRLENRIGTIKKNTWVVIDEIQKIPALLDEVHRLIESRNYKFILTGSSARKLKSQESNMLAGRAYYYQMFPLTVEELGESFDLKESLRWGHLPGLYAEGINKKDFLKAYIETYLRQEILQEGLTRNLDAFTRFLEAASFSQGSVLNMSEVAREAAVNRKVVEGYFSLVEDMLIADRLPVFTRRSKRRLVSHPKFYFFDTGVFRSIRPQGPLDSEDELMGVCLETLVFQELIAQNHYKDFDYKIYYWRSSDGAEVDFVLYGPRGLIAIEVKKSRKLKSKDFSGLKTFKKEFPEARLYCFYGGESQEENQGISVLPVDLALRQLSIILGSGIEAP
jgi:uncharacterized protein